MKFSFDIRITCFIVVAPLVGAWIEINLLSYIKKGGESLPLWERGLKSDRISKNRLCIIVAPLVGAWIEIIREMSTRMIFSVAPLVGAWIEMVEAQSVLRIFPVAPLVGAWIEIGKNGTDRCGRKVAPLVGAWIEIFTDVKTKIASMSLPLWERGLKSTKASSRDGRKNRRSPCGSVD